MFTTGRRHFLKITDGAVLFAAIAASDAAYASTRPQTTLRVTVGKAREAGQGVQFDIGMRSGIFTRNGVDVKLRLFDSNAAIGPALVAGSLSVITDGDVPGIPLFAAGAPVKALCPISDFSTDQAIVVNASITSPHDLLGKRIAVFKGSVPTLLIERYAAHYHLDLQRIHVLNMTPPQQLAALAAKEIDGYASWEPWVWNGLHKIPGTHVLVRDGEPYYFMRTFELLVVREDYLKSHPVLIRNLLRALLEATKTLENPTPAYLLKVAEYLTNIAGKLAPLDALAAMIKRRRYSMAIDSAFLAAEKQNTEFLAKAGKIAHVVPVDSWLDREPLRLVDPSLIQA